MIAECVTDPFTRFISPEEFKGMMKYDITGIGLNLVTGTSRGLVAADLLGQICRGPHREPAVCSFACAGEEYSRKSGSPLPEGRSPSGIFVLGVVKSSLSDQAGIEQGDELLSVDGRPMDSLSPFQVRGLATALLTSTIPASAISPRAASGFPQAANLIQGAEQEGTAAAPGPSSSRVALEFVKSSGSRETVEVDRPAKPVSVSPVSYKLQRRESSSCGSRTPMMAQIALVGSAPSCACTCCNPASLVCTCRGPRGEKMGVIRLTSFNAQAQKKVKEAIQALENQGEDRVACAVHGSRQLWSQSEFFIECDCCCAGAERLVLDLQDNRGGLVNEGIEVARLFLDDNAVVVITEGRARSSDQPVTAPGPALTKLPLVVLVNDHTASASEILAGSLKDNCRAVIGGSQTYGKGLIQSVYELADGSGLVVTVGKYLTPNGTEIDQRGITPDFRGIPELPEAERVIKACKVGRTSN